MQFLYQSSDNYHDAISVPMFRCFLRSGFVEFSEFASFYRKVTYDAIKTILDEHLVLSDLHEEVPLNIHQRCLMNSKKKQIRGTEVLESLCLCLV